MSEVDTHSLESTPDFSAPEKLEFLLVEANRERVLQLYAKRAQKDPDGFVKEIGQLEKKISDEDKLLLRVLTEREPFEMIIGQHSHDSSTRRNELADYAANVGMREDPEADRPALMGALRTRIKELAENWGNKPDTPTIDDTLRLAMLYQAARNVPEEARTPKIKEVIRLHPDPETEWANQRNRPPEPEEADPVPPAEPATPESRPSTDANQSRIDSAVQQLVEAVVRGEGERPYEFGRQLAEAENALGAEEEDKLLAQIDPLVLTTMLYSSNPRSIDGLRAQAHRIAYQVSVPPEQTGNPEEWRRELRRRLIERVRGLAAAGDTLQADRDGIVRLSILYRAKNELSEIGIPVRHKPAPPEKSSMEGSLGDTDNDLSGLEDVGPETTSEPFGPNARLHELSAKMQQFQFRRVRRHGEVRQRLVAEYEAEKNASNQRWQQQIEELRARHTAPDGTLDTDAFAKELIAKVKKGGNDEVRGTQQKLREAEGLTGVMANRIEWYNKLTPRRRRAYLWGGRLALAGAGVGAAVAIPATFGVGGAAALYGVRGIKATQSYWLGMAKTQKELQDRDFGADLTAILKKQKEETDPAKAAKLWDDFIEKAKTAPGDIAEQLLDGANKARDRAVATAMVQTALGLGIGHAVDLWGDDIARFAKKAGAGIRDGVNYMTESYKSPGIERPDGGLSAAPSPAAPSAPPSATPPETPGAGSSGSAPEYTAPQEAPVNPGTIESAPQTHSVVRGDTLWDIAESHLENQGFQPNGAEIAGEVERISNLNHDLLENNPDIIYPGQELVLETTPIPGNIQPISPDIFADIHEDDGISDILERAGFQPGESGRVAAAMNESLREAVLSNNPEITGDLYIDGATNEVRLGHTGQLHPETQTAINRAMMNAVNSPR